MTPSVVIIGCGGQGREIGGMLTDNGIAVVGYVDDQPSELNLTRVAAQELRFLGGRDSLGSSGATHYVAGIASGRLREMLVPLAERAGLAPFTFTHPDATVGSDCVLGVGSVIWSGARLTTNVRLGSHVHVNQNVTIGHDTVIADFATLNPSSSVSGNVVVAERALIGAASVVLQGRSVGHDAIVGAAACLTRDLPPSRVAVGVPARWSQDEG